MLQALFQSAQHLYEKRKGSGSRSGSGCPTLVSMYCYWTVLHLNFFYKCNILLHVFWQAWFTARMAFTRTTAVMSIMGYMLGLGDRHLENINVDTTTGHSTKKIIDEQVFFINRLKYFNKILFWFGGQCFHVDMNSLFNVNETYAVRMNNLEFRNNLFYSINYCKTLPVNDCASCFTNCLNCEVCRVTGSRNCALSSHPQHSRRFRTFGRRGTI